MQVFKNGRLPAGRDAAMSSAWGSSAAPASKGADTQAIHVAPAVLDAAAQDTETLLRTSNTSLSGLTEDQAAERIRLTGPNEISRERKLGWPI
jgi:hypothetical protein